MQGCWSTKVFERVISVLTAVRCELSYQTASWLLVQNNDRAVSRKFHLSYIQIWRDLVSEGRRSFVLHRPVPTSYRGFITAARTECSRLNHQSATSTHLCCKLRALPSDSLSRESTRIDVQATPEKQTRIDDTAFHLYYSLARVCCSAFNFECNTQICSHTASARKACTDMYKSISDLIYVAGACILCNVCVHAFQILTVSVHVCLCVRLFVRVYIPTVCF